MTSLIALSTTTIQHSQSLPMAFMMTLRARLSISSHSLWILESAGEEIDMKMDVPVWNRRIWRTALDCRIFHVFRMMCLKGFGSVTLSSQVMNQMQGIARQLASAQSRKRMLTSKPLHQGPR